MGLHWFPFYALFAAFLPDVCRCCRLEELFSMLRGHAPWITWPAVCSALSLQHTFRRVRYCLIFPRNSAAARYACLRLRRRRCTDGNHLILDDRATFYVDDAAWLSAALDASPWDRDDTARRAHDPNFPGSRRDRSYHEQLQGLLQLCRSAFCSHDGGLCPACQFGAHVTTIRNKRNGHAASLDPLLKLHFDGLYEHAAMVLD